MKNPYMVPYSGSNPDLYWHPDQIGRRVSGCSGVSSGISGARMSTALKVPSQTLLIDRKYAELPHIASGLEEVYGMAMRGAETPDGDSDWIVEARLNGSSINTNILLLLRNASSKVVVVSIPIYSTDMDFGYPFKHPIGIPTVGDAIPPNTVLATPPSDIDGWQASGTNVASVTLTDPDVPEDAWTISESLSKRLRYKRYATYNIYLTNSVLIPCKNGKLMPDVGDIIEPGEPFIITREIGDSRVLACSPKASKPMIGDAIYTASKFAVPGKIIVSEFKSTGKLNHIGTLDAAAVGKYDINEVQTKAFVKKYKELANNGCTMEPSAIMTYLIPSVAKGVKFIKDKHPLAPVQIKIVVEHTLHADVKAKLTDRFGGKGVVTCVRPDHLMPVDGDGMRVDLIRGGHVFLSRDITGADIHTLKGAMVIKVEHLIGKRLGVTFGNVKRLRTLMGKLTQDDYNYIYDKLHGLYSVISPTQGVEFEALCADNFDELAAHIEHILKHRITVVNTLEQAVAYNTKDMMAHPRWDEFKPNTELYIHNPVTGKHERHCQEQYIDSSYFYILYKDGANPSASSDITRNENGANSYFNSLETGVPVRCRSVKSIAMDEISGFSSNIPSDAFLEYLTTGHYQRTPEIMDSLMDGNPFPPELKRNLNITLLKTVLQARGLELVD